MTLEGVDRFLESSTCKRRSFIRKILYQYQGEKESLLIKLAYTVGTSSFERGNKRSTFICEKFPKNDPPLQRHSAPFGVLVSFELK